jgi:protein tyrosine/serine phosphatase
VSERLRWLELDGAVNARDVGGLRLSGGDGDGVVAAGRLLRADNLQGLSERDVRRLVDELGLRAVVDLRTGVEVELEGPGPLTHEPAVVVEHRSLYPETGGETDLDAETIAPWGAFEPAGADAGELPVVQAYLGYLRRRPDSVVAAVRTIAKPPGDGAVLVHCAAGKDRTGVVVAFALEAAGVAREEVVRDYLASRERIEAIVGRLASSPTYADEVRTDDPQSHAPRDGTMERVLALVDERHGGAAAWLLAHGLGEHELAALRARLAPSRALGDAAA